MYPVDIRLKAHYLILYAILCCESILASVLDPKLAFATRKEYIFWLSEQAALQTLVYRSPTHPWPDIHSGMPPLRQDPSDIMTTDLGKTLENISHENLPDLSMVEQHIPINILIGKSIYHLFRKDTADTDRRQLISKLHTSRGHLMLDALCLVVETYRRLMASNE
jgi:hypothetical protein